MSQQSEMKNMQAEMTFDSVFYILILQLSYASLLLDCMMFALQHSSYFVKRQKKWLCVLDPIAGWKWRYYIQNDVMIFKNIL